MRQTQNTKKDNRKSVFVVALLLLLVAVIGFGGYTMSKYISSRQEEGKANVAKWGFTVSTDTTKLFGEEYVAGVIGDSTAQGAVVTAKVDTTGHNIVAPGHSGSMTFTVAGTAEVKAKISISIEDGYKDVVLNYKKGKDGEVTSYNPVVWTLTKEGETEALATGTLETIANKLKTIDTAYAAGEKAISEKYTLSWAWVFEDAKNPDADALDTLLGWTASKTKIPADYGYSVEADTNTTIAFKLNISIAQVMA